MMRNQSRDSVIIVWSLAPFPTAWSGGSFARLLLLHCQPSFHIPYRPSVLLTVRELRGVLTSYRPSVPALLGTDVSQAVTIRFFGSAVKHRGLCCIETNTSNFVTAGLKHTSQAYKTRSNTSSRSQRQIPTTNNHYDQSHQPEVMGLMWTKGWGGKHVGMRGLLNQTHKLNADLSARWWRGRGQEWCPTRSVPIQLQGLELLQVRDSHRVLHPQ